MKSALTHAAWIGLAVATAGVPSFAQFRDNSEKQMTCENGDRDGDRVRHCEIREQSAPAIGSLNIDGLRNGGANIKGWSRGDVLVRARVETAADNEGAAAGLATQVSIDTSGGQVVARGPENRDNSWWSVSYEIFLPHNTNLTLKTHNGGINISDVRGQIRFEGNNGGVNMKRVAGDLTGSTVNGGINVELVGVMSDFRQLDLSTRNGGVNVAMPSTFSARFQAETNNGGIHSDFALPPQPQSNARPRKLDAVIGAGGPLIHVTTNNGQVSLKKTELQ
jgi:hypothetical protein